MWAVLGSSPYLDGLATELVTSESVIHCLSSVNPNAASPLIDNAFHACNIRHADAYMVLLVRSASIISQHIRLKIKSLTVAVKRMSD